MRARQADKSGFIERDGVRVAYEVHGSGDPTILLFPTWTLVHSRLWKMQVPYLARHHRVITFDPRGNGLSDRPADRSAYAEKEFVADALAILDELGVEQVVAVGVSMGAQRTLLMAADHPDRVLGAVVLGPYFPVSGDVNSRIVRAINTPVGRRAFSLPMPAALAKGKARFSYGNARRDFADFVEYFIGECTCEPHSTKVYEDAVGWALEGDADAAFNAFLAEKAAPVNRHDQLALAARVRCPVLVICGTHDRATPHADAVALAEATGGRMLSLRGADHLPQARRPVAVNLAIREFADSSYRRDPDPTVHRSNGHKRAIFVSSPIGLGHARRDVAIARELRALVPGLEIDWLAQDPVTHVLAAEGERIHPASEHLASETRHIETEARSHELHCFQALRRMDEILTTNYHVFDDVVRETRYDLWIGDEAWELDYHLHKNPERKIAPFAWLTDFVGYLPTPEGGADEARLTADYNAEMVEHVRDQPQIRDRAIFIGEPDDAVTDPLGPGLPGVRDWTCAHFDFSGYVTGFDPTTVADRERVRDELGYGPGERVVVVTVGGSGVGTDLLRRVVAAFPAARAALPGLRMVVAAGPRIDPASLGEPVEGLEIHPYVHDLYRHLAVADLAIVQGGLATTMELTAAGRPFLYFPLRRHFEQQFHVAHRLDRHGAGRRLDFDAATPDVITAAITEELGRDVDYVAVPDGAARRAAARIAELIS